MLTAAQKTRVIFVIMGFLVITFLLVARLFWLQVVHPSHWVSIARRQHLQMLELSPRRGSILDRHETPLALSIRLTSVFANPRQVKDPVGTARQLAPLLNQPIAQLQEKLSHRERGFVWLARRVPSAVSSQIRGMRSPGIDFVMEPKRLYPQGVLASHLIGFAGLDSKGLEGLELAYDSLLRGEPGWRWLARDARHRPIGGWDSPMVSPRDGLDIILTVDNNIQFIAERELDAVYRKYHAKGASIIVMNPMTGEILALANRPTTDCNLWPQALPETRRNRVVTDTFEPGSVFKVVTASTALAKGVVRLGDVFYCEHGVFPIAGHVLHDHEPYGELTFRQIITNSSNIGTVKVAMRLGANSMYEGMKAFGFGSPTGVGIPGEVGGVTKSPRIWSKTSITAMPIGQEVTVTAMQLAQAISVIANGGFLVRPWIVREIRHSSGTVVKDFKPIIVRRVISPEVNQQMREILEAVVQEGTGKLAEVSGFRAAGKTGTAQKVDPSGVYSHSRFMASFIGFVPVEHPRLTIVVVVDEPHPVYYGGSVSAPVFSKVAADTLAYLSQKGVVVSKNES